MKDDDVPSGDEDHYHPDLEDSLNTSQMALHIILCTILDELDQSQRDRIHKKLATYRGELCGSGDQEQRWIGSFIERFIWAMDNHTPLKDIDPFAP
jgi:hypothetical protein